MSDGISDRFPFLHETERELSVIELKNLLHKFYLLHLQKDARITTLEELLREIRDRYTLPNSYIAKRIDEVCK